MKTCSTGTVVFLFLSTIAFGQGDVLEKTLTHQGVERTYNLYVPSTYTANEVTPLVLNMHGLFGNADQQMATSAMNPVAEEEGFLVAYPNAIDGDWSHNEDHDISFIDALLGNVGSEYSVDSSRIYATGYSQGGIMSYLLAVSRPNTYAAIAPVSGVRLFFPEGIWFPSFVPRVASRPVPLMHIHGTSDTWVPYNGGNTAIPGLEFLVFESVESTLDAWVNSNGCDLTPLESELPDIAPDDNSTVAVLSYQDCDKYTSVTGAQIAADVVHYRVNDAGHSWPVLDADRAAALAAYEETYGTDLLPVFTPLNSDFYASAEIWGFFEQHIAPVVSLPPGVVGNPGLDNNPGLGGKLPPGLRDGLPPQSRHSVPEPASANLLLLGCCIVFLVRRYSPPS